MESCGNLTIEGVTWIGCGVDAIPVIAIYHSSNVIIQKCYFQHSMGQVVSLIGVLGYVNINHCKFVNNNYYRDQGATIKYSSNNSTNVHMYMITINNCDFGYNGGAESSIYILRIPTMIYFNTYISITQIFTIIKVYPFIYQSIMFCISLEK